MGAEMPPIMIIDLGNKCFKGQEFYYHEVRKIGRTRQFEVFTKIGAKIVGHIRWTGGQYCFVPLNAPLTPKNMLELTAFCKMQLMKQREHWKPRKNKFNKTYDMTKRNAKRGQIPFRYSSVEEQDSVKVPVGGSIPSTGAILEENV